jgi:hypothetical protein
MSHPLQPNNTTKENAYARVAYAQIGSLVAPTEEYLMSLRAQLYAWIEKVDAKLCEVHAQQAREEECHEDQAEADCHHR